MSDKKEEKKEEVKATDKELSINSTLAGAIGYQNWEQARDKTIDDHYFGERNKVILKLSIYMRRLKEQRLKELAESNGGKITVDMRIKVATELSENKILTDMANTVRKFSDVTSCMEDRSEKDIRILFTPKDIMSETYYHDLVTLEKMDALLTALIDNDDIPVVPKPGLPDLILDDLIKDFQEEE
jgi:hypothetical protein